MSETTYTRLQVEAAQIVWEELFERMFIREQEFPKLVKYREGVGIVQMRSDAVDIGVWAEAAYQLIPDTLTDSHAYDAEIIPMFVDLVDWDKHINPYSSDPHPLPSVEEAARLVGRELYDSICDGALRSMYGIDFTTDSGVSEVEMSVWFEVFWGGDDSGSPLAVAKAWGEKYDLTLLTPQQAY